MRDSVLDQDQSFALEGNYRHVSDCWRLTILKLVPSLVFLLTAVFELGLSANHKSLRWGEIAVTRIILSSLLCLIHGFQLTASMAAFAEGDKLPILCLLTPFSLTLADAVTILVLVRAVQKGFFRTGVVWTYVFTSAFASLLNSYLLVSSSVIMSAELMIEFLCLPLLLILLLLCSFSDATDSQSKQHPQETCSFPSMITLHWCSRMAIRAWRQTIGMQDLHHLPVEIRSQAVHDQLNSQIMRMTEEKGRISSSMALVRTFYKTFAHGAFFRLCKDLLNLTKPILLRYLMLNVTGPDSSGNGLALCFLLFAASLLSNVFYIISLVSGARLGLMIRSSLMTNTYKKALNMNIARSGFTVGGIVNLMSVDTEQFYQLCIIINDLWAAPLSILIGSVLLYSQLRAAAFASMAVLLLSLPVNAITSRFMRKEQERQVAHKDERTNFMSEILSGMKAIKLYAWEDEFMTIAQRIRDQEARHIIRGVCYNALLLFVVNITNVFVLLATFTAYVLMNGEDALDPAQVFFIITLLNLIRTPLADAANALPQLMNVSVSFDRFDRFFASPDKENYVQRTESGGHAIRIEKALFSWRKEEDGFQLRVEDMRVREGSLVAVIGSVGSGKSSLMNALLGEMQLRSGNVAVKMGKIAFVPQQAWIMNKSLRDNILFYKGFEKTKYSDVVRKCELEPDLKILPAGDETEIGEKGINLSGGQKQRVSIARACYSDADLFLFDDPLSAVDAHVSKSLFDNVLSSKTGMLRGRTRILITNNLSVLPHVDTIFVMKDGVISESGSFDELMSGSEQRAGDFKTLIQKFGSEQKTDDKGKVEEQDNLDANSIRRRKSLVEEGSYDGTLTKSEAVETGMVKFDVFISYFRHFSFLIYFVITGFFLSQVFEMGSNYWLSQWSAEPMHELRGANQTAVFVQADDRLTVYALLCLLSALFLLMAMTTMALATVRAGNYLHSEMLTRVMGCPMLFFETTPIGRILSRFAKDINGIDRQIFPALSMTLTGAVQVTGAFVMIMIAVPLFVVAFVPLFTLVIVMQRISVSSLRQNRRMESTNRSIVYSHFSETLSGHCSIRAYDCCHLFQQEAQFKTDQMTICNSSSCDLMGWANFRFELISNVTVLLTSLYAVLNRGSGDESLTGLAITYAILLSSLINTLIRGLSTFETEAVSIERVIEYATQLQPEEQANQTMVAPDSEWPSEGKIDFVDYVTRYRPELDPVLRGVTITIRSGEKVGIVGRTGAGKSSITLALFRVIEPTGGKIMIDGIDTTSIKLRDLRSKLTIIPQDPILFTGSIRRNLDPAGRHSDEELWSSLRVAGMADFVTKQESGLESLIAEGGENLSVGQRQLVCLSRAVLRKTQILVLDEATAAVDVETDAMIQKTIRQQFADCTVLTIAHRIHTILDSDRVLVLDAGSVVEFDDPQRLLSDQNSIFYSLSSDALLHNPSQD